MRIDPTAARIRRLLVGEVLALAAGQAKLVHHVERGWASVTFAGTRHILTLTFTEPLEAGENFIALLPEHQFTIPGQLVADATVISVDHGMSPTPRLTVEVELLLLQEA